MKLAIFGMVCATVGWLVGAAPADSGLQGTWARTRLHRRELLALCRANMENQFTPGYKASQTAFDFDEPARPAINMAQGEIFKTQNPLNVAINGRGFFTLEGGTYTRDGRFSWQNGRLCDASGRAVLGTQGPLLQGTWPVYHFAEGGTLYGETPLVDPVTGHEIVRDTPLGKLAIVAFDNPELLARAGVTGFTATREAGPARPCPDAEVCPASLELANVDFMLEGSTIGRLTGSGAPPLAMGMPSAPLGILGNGGKAPAGDPFQLNR